MTTQIEDIQLIYVDLFCGAGGTTEGITQANYADSKVAIVAVAVNHDENAIDSHAANHPETVHFKENIKKLNVYKVNKVVNHFRALYPQAKVVLWASIDCTNHSKAKGGVPKNADSRTLPWYLPRYIKVIKPDYIQVENVREFMSWGEMDENNKPISRKNGIYWVKWCQYICRFGYRDEWRMLNAANYGAYTNRDRLFGIFALGDLPIIFPEPTHAKNPPQNKDMFGRKLEQWKPVREVLELEKVGNSIFGRKVPLVEKTLMRIYAGLVKFVANGDDSFMQHYYSSDNPFSKVSSLNEPCATITTVPHQSIVWVQKYNSGGDKNRNKSIEMPLDVITTANRHSLIDATVVDKEFLLQTYAANSKGDNVFSTKKPSRTITTRDSTQLVQPVFLIKYNNKSVPMDVEDPASTLSTKDRLGMITAFIAKDFSGWGNIDRTIADIERPSGVILTVPKDNLIQVQGVKEIQSQFLMNPQYESKGGSIENPCFTLIARMDKMPPYLITTEHGELAIPVFNTDSEMTIKIKLFMAHFGIIDVKQRMLYVSELKRIQGFPLDYVLKGNQDDQKKCIGNSVVPHVVTKWTVDLALEVFKYNQKQLWSQVA